MSLIMANGDMFEGYLALRTMRLLHDHRLTHVLCMCRSTTPHFNIAMVSNICLLAKTIYGLKIYTEDRGHFYFIIDKLCIPG